MLFADGRHAVGQWLCCILLRLFHGVVAPCCVIVCFALAKVLDQASTAKLLLCNLFFKLLLDVACKLISVLAPALKKQPFWEAKQAPAQYRELPFSFPAEWKDQFVFEPPLGHCCGLCVGCCWGCQASSAGFLVGLLNILFLRCTVAMTCNGPPVC